jgi:4-amino-4-deoxy-L-arabinose transferase-like glycosyltransferase
MRIVAYPGWCLAAILVVALGVRLAAGFWWQARLPAGVKFAFGDSESYWQLGRAIARQEPYAYGPDDLRIFRTPGYPALLAPLFWLCAEPPVMWARAVSAILSTAAVAAVAALGWLLFDRLTGLVAAALAALYPEAIALGVFVLSEAPFAPLMMLNLVCWILAWQRGRHGWSLAAGIAAGLATLMRPSWLLMAPFTAVVPALLIVLLMKRDERATALRRHFEILAVSLLGLVLTMTPWWIRNYRVSGRFVPTTLQVGASLYDGLSPTATGGSDMRFVGRFVAEQRAADADAPGNKAGLFEDRLDRRMRDASVQWARQHPRRVLELMVIKLARLWSPLPNADEFQSRWLRLALLCTYTPLMVLALVGLWRNRRRGWPIWLCVLPAIYLTCLHVVFVSSIRYRGPAMLPLIVVAAAAIVRARSTMTTVESQMPKE